MSALPQAQPRHVAIIGAGVVGVSTALWLQREGCDVTIIDTNDGFGDGASYGNAGCLNHSSIVPISMPGNLAKVPGWLMDPLGPLTIRWPYLPKITPWLLQFLAAGRPAKVHHQAAALMPLLAQTVELYTDLAEPDAAQALIRRNGHLIVYRSQAGFEGDKLGWDLRRKNGIQFEVLNAEELRQLEPSLSHDVKIGVFFPQNGYVVSPKKLVAALGANMLRNGGHFLRGTAQDFVFEGAALRGLRADGNFLPADAIVVAAGARSLPFAKAAGDPVMLDTERGYHIVINNPEAIPNRSIMDASGKFVATPMEAGLRLAGTVEFAGLEAAPDWRRARMLSRLGKALFPALQADYTEDRLSLWMGFRPSMPDSLPVIGTSSRSPDIVYAFGHGHIGLAAGARTGKLAAELAMHRPAHFDITPFSPKRFQ